MGINIIAYKLLNKTIDETDLYKREYWSTERVEFDSLRRSGDKDFVFNSNLEWDEIMEDENDPWYVYVRPKNLDIAERWIKDNIIEGNQPRLLELINKMRKDPMIYLIIS